MPLHDSGYQHWDGAHIGLWRRRWVIAWNGMRACLQNRWLRYLVLLSWTLGLVVAALLFLIGQLLVTDSIVADWISTLSSHTTSNYDAFAKSFTTWLEKHPEVSVRTSQDILFYYYGMVLMPMSVFALGMAIPIFITRDLASNAIIIYASKAVSRGDYLLGKFTAAFGLLTLTWLGPLCASWLVGNLLAPDWGFFWHSRIALGHALCFALCGMVVLSALALGMSATSTREKSTVAFWFLWWIAGGVITPIATFTQPWLRHLNFSFDLRQLALAIFRLGDDIKLAQDKIPVLGAMIRIRPETLSTINSPSLWGSLLALGLMSSLALLVIHRKVRAE
jgi:ABC-2 type transport system permease protein